ncbi:hypothetical protein AMI01nite_44860 [Aneurinibacillus migulanus]|nr:hypothetical protein AMI01nite_44860 [Aneurinibacillus migulanus]
MTMLKASVIGAYSIRKIMGRETKSAVCVSVFFWSGFGVTKRSCPFLVRKKMREYADAYPFFLPLYG